MVRSRRPFAWTNPSSWNRTTSTAIYRPETYNNAASATSNRVRPQIFREDQQDARDREDEGKSTRGLGPVGAPSGKQQSAQAGGLCGTAGRCVRILFSNVDPIAQQCEEDGGILRIGADACRRLMLATPPDTENSIALRGLIDLMQGNGQFLPAVFDRQSIPARLHPSPSSTAPDAKPAAVRCFKLSVIRAMSGCSGSLAAAANRLHMHNACSRPAIQTSKHRETDFWLPNETLVVRLSRTATTLASSIRTSDRRPRHRNPVPVSTTHRRAAPRTAAIVSLTTKTARVMPRTKQKVIAPPKTRRKKPFSTTRTATTRTQVTGQRCL